MRGHDQIIANLNELLADELSAINQYTVHSEMCANWGYEKLHEVIAKRAIVEMKHAERLIGRIIFLEGTPDVSTLTTINIGRDVPRQHANDLEAEHRAVRTYNAGIQLARELGDHGTREMLDEILKAEGEHVDYIEGQLEQIKQMGIQPYLAEQID